MLMINVHSLVIGCSVGVISAAAQALGLTLQRKSYIEADTRHTKTQSIDVDYGILEFLCICSQMSSALQCK